MNAREKKFVQTVWEFYRQFGRHDLPWRQTTDPYCVMVSEIMLQQTQVDRVIPKYLAFVAKYPSAADLAAAQTADVLTLWQGLGYNRRALMLLRAAQNVMECHGGTFPTTVEGLRALSGVGPYTAGAIMAFAYDTPMPIIETNIRAVYLHHFFPDEHDVTDARLFEYITRTLPVADVRGWYAALMDYGSYLKRTQGNASKRSRHHVVQKKFAGSNRQLRGLLLREVTNKKRIKETELCALASPFTSTQVHEQLAALVREGLLSVARGKYQLPV